MDAHKECTMKTMTIFELSKTDYNVRFLACLQQFWATTKTFSCINVPKKQHIFLHLNGCKAKYVMKNGKVFTAKSNDVVYCPQGCEYTVEFFDFETEKSHTIGLNFFLFDEENQPIALSDEIVVFSCKGVKIRALFEESLRQNSLHFIPTNPKAATFRIINEIAENEQRKSFNPLIAKGIEYLNERYMDDPPIADLARLCYVSEVYFRRLFKKETGVSPLEYKTALRMQKAQEWLAFDDVPVGEIARQLGYATAHFIQQFKAHYGVSPLAYRRQYQG